MNSPKPGQRQETAHPPAEPVLCPECGKPIEQCGCIARWEDEGGATEAGRIAEDSETPT
ncbi:hypothetical protein [Castellaniella sp.]|uniref:hypothetical protein n=1 Tax=Castellaniella sp. TaxID=1955812 RepID=UPI0035632ABA